MPRTAHIFLLLLIAIATSYAMPWLRERTNSARVADLAARERKLDAKLPMVSVQGRPAEEVLNDLAREIGVAVRFDSAALAAACIDLREPITMRLYSVRGRLALDIACDGVHGLVWRPEADGGGIVISSRNDRTHVYLRAYDYSGVLKETARADRRRRPDIDPQDAIKQLVRDIVEPDTWRDPGGAFGFLSEDRLLVVQRPVAHRQVQEITEHYQWQFESRYILVDRFFYPGDDTGRRGSR